MARGISREHIALAGLLLLALAVRAGVARLNHVLQGDEGAYLWLGRTLMSGGGYQFFGRPELHYTPGYPIVSGLVWLIVRDLELASKICFVLFGTLTVPPVYLLCRRLYGRPSALAAAGLVAVSPALTSYTIFYGSMTEPLYFCLLFWAMYASITAMEEGRWPAFALAGALFGTAYLTRPEGCLWLAATAVYLAVVFMVERRPPARSLAGLGALLAGFLLVAFPYLLYLRQHLGYWTLTGKSWMAYIQQITLAEGRYVEFDRMSWALDSTGREVMYHSTEKFTQHSLLGEFLSNPLTFIRHTLQNVRELDGIFLSKRVLPFFLLPFIGLGLFRAGWDRKRLRAELYLIALVLVTSAALAVFTNQLRFYLGTLIVLLIWAGHGLVEFSRWAGETLAQWMRAERAGRWARGMLIVGTAGVCAYYLAVLPAAVQDGLAYQHFHYKEVGEWLKANSAPTARIMSRGAIVALHADRFWVPFPHASYEEVLRFARENRVDYLVVNQHEFEVMRPQLAFLGDPSQAPPELEPL
ncbi:MAG: glycosyltransferase family 39 protein, partial [Anaerolineae bacterium]